MFLLASFLFAAASLIYVFLFVAIVYHIQEYLPPQKRLHRIVLVGFTCVSIILWINALYTLLHIPH